MKSTFMICLLTLFTFSLLSQEKAVDLSQYNLPPGTFLNPKADRSKDFSYKLYDLEKVNTSYRELDFEITQEELTYYKENDTESYNYYTNALKYFKSLSNRIKNLYEADELWYIYMYDLELTKKLAEIN